MAVRECNFSQGKKFIRICTCVLDKKSAASLLRSRDFCLFAVFSTIFAGDGAKTVALGISAADRGVRSGGRDGRKMAGLASRPAVRHRQKLPVIRGAEYRFT